MLGRCTFLLSSRSCPLPSSPPSRSNGGVRLAPCTLGTLEGSRRLRNRRTPASWKNCRESIVGSSKRIICLYRAPFPVPSRPVLTCPVLPFLLLLCFCFFLFLRIGLGTDRQSRGWSLDHSPSVPCLQVGVCAARAQHILSRLRSHLPLACGVVICGRTPPQHGHL